MDVFYGIGYSPCSNFDNMRYRKACRILIVKNMNTVKYIAASVELFGIVIQSTFRFVDKGGDSFLLQPIDDSLFLAIQLDPSRIQPPLQFEEDTCSYRGILEQANHKAREVSSDYFD